MYKKELLGLYHELTWQTNAYWKSSFVQGMKQQHNSKLERAHESVLKAAERRCLAGDFTPAGV